MDALRMHGIRLGFPGAPRVLDGASLRVPAGRLVALEGHSGSGKSSLLQVAAGLQAPDAGRIRILGEEAPGDEAGWAALRGRTIGLVFQHLNLLLELTVQENVELPLRLAGASRSQRTARVRSLLERFRLAGLAQRRPDALSGGEQQRTAIARALALKPGLLLVDEPTSALDADNAASVLQALREAARSGAGILVATHDDAFRSVKDRYRLRDGRLEQA